VLTPETLQEIDARVKQVVDDAASFAENSADPDPGDAVTDVYGQVVSSVASSE
jgi:pyruvate dehydrogenase E1 component alpha subunit